MDYATWHRQPAPPSHHLAVPPPHTPSKSNAPAHYAYSHMQQPYNDNATTSGIRRVRSIGALPSATPSAAALYPPHVPVMPPSPVSPTHHRSMQRQPPQAAPGSGWFAEPRDARLDRFSQAPAAVGQPFRLEAVPPVAAYQYPPQASPNRRPRDASEPSAHTTPARTSYSPPPGLSVAIPEYTATPMSYSHTTPASTKAFQQPTAEEVSKFFQDMTDILGEEAMAALSPASPTNVYAPTRPSTVPAPPSRPTTSSSAPSTSQPQYNVSGILLSEEDYHRYAESPATSRQPSPAQAFVPPRATYQPSPPSYGVDPLSIAPGPPQDYSSYGYDIGRPQSAPPTPSVESAPAFPAYASPFDGPALGSAQLNRRRGSSLDLSAVPRSIPSGLAVPDMYSPTRPTQPLPPYGAPAASYAPSAFYSAPPRSYAPVTPTRAPHASFGAAHPTALTTPPSSSASAASVGSTTSATPPRRNPGGRRKNGSVAFINFSAADSRALLNGVAPSGSQKKRQREEDEAREREAKRVAGERE
ncbi:hypothetical protein JCM10207_002309 [Rhodosporidiobolus poonsookiae]